MTSETERATTLRDQPRTHLLEIHSPITGVLERTREPTPPDRLPDVVGAARAAQKAWAARSFSDRAKHLRAFVDVLAENAEEVAERIHHYNGKTRDEALMAEVFPTMATFEYFARHAARHLRPRTIRPAALPLAYSRLEFEPLGVVGFITPWNFPFKLMLQDVPAALMAGNAIVIKVSEHATAIGELIEDLLQRAGMPAHLVQLVYGFGDLGAALIESGIDKVCFTGSTATGRKVYEAAARRLIPCTLELGGKDPAILLEDADLDEAARGILWAGLTNCGQACASVELVYVPEFLKEKFLEKLKTLLGALPPDQLGTMNVRFQKEKVEKQLREALELGARVVARVEPADAENPFAEPAVIVTDVPEQAALRREETFGPVLPVIGYTDLEQVLEEVARSPYGLTASIWTGDRRKGAELARRIDAGVVTVNDHLITPGMPEAPWGGHKQSGLGSSMSYLSLQAFSKVRYVFHDRGLVRFKFWRYPYTAEKARWFRDFLRGQFARSLPIRVATMVRALPKLLLRRNPRWEDRGRGKTA